MTLPITVPFGDDEPWTGMASRLAIANGYSSMKSFLASAGIHRSSIASGDEKALKLLAKWSGASTHAIARYAIPVASKGAIWKLGDAWFVKEARRGNRIRLCPNCIMEDIEAGEGLPSARPRLRAPWLTRAFKNCVQHRRPILEIDVTHKNADEFSRSVDANLDLVRSAADETHAPADITVDSFVQERICGSFTQPHLNDLEVYVVTELAERFGAFLEAYTEALKETPFYTNHADARTLGFNVIAGGPQAIRSVLEAVINHVRPVQDMFFFGKFGVWLRRNSEIEDFKNTVMLFQDIAERNMPFSVGEMCFIPVRHRYMHNLISASAEYGVTTKRIKKLLVENGLIRDSDETPSRIYVRDDDNLRDILKSASVTLSAIEAQKVLGLGNRVMRNVMASGLLPRVEVTKEGRVFTRIRPEDLSDFQERMFSRAVVAEAIPDGYAPLKAICRNYAKPVDQFLSLVIEGKVSQIVTTKDHGYRLTNLYFSRKEVKRVLRAVRDCADREAGSSLISFGKAERRLGCMSSTIRMLAEAGYLEAVKGHESGFMHRQMLVYSQSLDQFCENYIAISQIAKAHGTSPMVATEQLADLGVFPAIGGDISGSGKSRTTRFYLRADVDHLKLVSRTGRRAVGSASK